MGLMFAKVSSGKEMTISKKLLRSKRLVGVALTLPALVCIMILTLYPIYETFVLSFSKLNLTTFQTEYIGLANYKRLFTSSVFWRTSKNMVIWISLFVPVHFLLGLLAALVLNQRERGRKVLRLIIFLPFTLCLVSVALSWRWLLHSDYGLINNFLTKVGLISLTRKWLIDPSTALYALVVVNTWFRYPFVMLLILAGLQTVPKDLISAAEVDGANKLQVFIHVTVPWLRNLIGLTLIMAIIWAMQIFTLIWLLTGGGPAHYTELFSTLIYRESFRNLNMTRASSVGVFLFLLTSFAVIPYLYLATKER